MRDVDDPSTTAGREDIELRPGQNLPTLPDVLGEVLPMTKAALLEPPGKI